MMRRYVKRIRRRVSVRSSQALASEVSLLQMLGQLR